MIDEFFLQNAVSIRRTYLKMTNNMDFYQKRAKEIVDRLELTIGKINDIQKKAEEGRAKKENGTMEILNDLVKILNEIEDEGKALENLVDPLNKDIEKLALEDWELYRLDVNGGHPFKLINKKECKFTLVQISKTYFNEI